MAYLDIWRQQLKHDLSTFAPLAKEDRSLNLIYGITAAAILWGVRDAPFNDDQKSALKEACGDEKHLPHLLRAVGGWDAMTPLEAARKLNKRQGESGELREALTALMGTFIEELFAEKVVQRQYIDISGTITGGNIVIGGYQIIAGDMVIQHITHQRIRACPTAPKPPAHFAGRRDELNRLKGVLGQGQSVAITGIQGVGGIGKTALSLQLASEMSEFSSVLWASLGPTPNTSTQLVEWARHADPDFDPRQDDLDVLVSRVQALLTNLIQDECPGRVLVILDDIWEGDSVRAARTLQKAAPVNSVSLITTRSQRVVAQMRSTRLELHPMTPEDALQMLRNLLADYPDIPSKTLLVLAEVVGYHPLAIELAAGQVTLLERPTQQITEQIERYRGGIPAGSPFRDIGLELGEDREDNLEIVLAFSYDNLTETEQAQFRALGVLAYNAPFDRDICRAIWDVDDPKPALDNLRHRALLGIAEDDGWYQQHVLLRGYARALLKQQYGLDEIFALYGEHITKVAGLFYTLPREEWRQVDPYVLHVNHVGNELVKQVAAIPDATPVLNRAGDFVRNVMGYVYYRPEMVETPSGLQRRGLDWLEMGLTVFRKQGNMMGESAMLSHIGLVLSDLGEERKSLSYYEQALQLSRQQNNRQREVSVTNNIGTVWSRLGEKDKALEYFYEALRQSRESGDKKGQVIALDNIGTVWQDRGEKKKALDFYQEALSLVRETRDKAGEATTLNNLASISDDLGRKYEALEYLEQALPLYQQLGDKFGEASMQSNFGKVWSDLGEKHKSLEYYSKALPVYIQIGSKLGEANTLMSIGVVWNELGNLPKALDYFEQALGLFQQIENKSGEANTLNSMGAAYEALGETEEALSCYQKALFLIQQIQDTWQEGAATHNIGKIYLSMGRQEEASEYLEKSLTLTRQTGNKSGEAATLDNIALLWSRRGEKQRAMDYLKQSLSLYEQIDDKFRQAISCSNIHTLCKEMGDLDGAVEYLERCVNLEEEIRHPDAESDRTALERLKHIRDRGGAVNPEEEFQALIARFAIIYRQRGAKAVRQMLVENGIPDYMIDAMMPKIKQMAGNDDEDNRQPMMPSSDQIRTLTAITLRVKTTEQSQLNSLKTQLLRARADFAGRRGSWSDTIDFINSLLNVLDDVPASLPDDNPFMPYLMELLGAIENFRR